MDCDAQELLGKLQDQVARQPGRVELKSFPDFICLRIPEQDRQLWSPRLVLNLESLANGRTRIEGLYGPNGSVWSLYLYAYLITGSLGLFSSILGLCQWKLDKPAWGLWVFALMFAAALTLYILAQFGQKLAMYQTHLLHQTYESALGSVVEIQ